MSSNWVLGSNFYIFPYMGFGFKVPHISLHGVGSTFPNWLEIPIVFQGNLLDQLPKAPKNVQCDGAVLSTFKEFDLKKLGVPIEAWPLEHGNYKGTKSYTVHSRSGAVP